MILSNYEFQHAPKRFLRNGAKPGVERHVIQYRVINGTAYHFETPYELVIQLEALQARGWGTEVRIWQGDPETGIPWPEEYDVVGRIGRSTGSLKIPLLVPRGDYGGPGLLDHCIVRMVRVYDNRLLYQHPKFQMPTFKLMPPRPENAPQGYVAGVAINGQLHAQFRDGTTAREWIKFMLGERFTHPEPVEPESVQA